MGAPSVGETPLEMSRWLAKRKTNPPEFCCPSSARAAGALSVSLRRQFKSRLGADVGNFFSAMQRGVQAMGEAPDGERYTVANRPVQCTHCRGDRFVEWFLTNPEETG